MRPFVEVAVDYAACPGCPLLEVKAACWKREAREDAAARGCAERESPGLNAWICLTG